MCNVLVLQTTNHIVCGARQQIRQAAHDAVQANKYGKRQTLFCGFFSTIRSKTENVLSFLEQKTYSGIRLIDYSVGFYDAQFSHVRALSC